MRQAPGCEVKDRLSFDLSLHPHPTEGSWQSFPIPLQALLLLLLLMPRVDRPLDLLAVWTVVIGASSPFLSFALSFLSLSIIMRRNWTHTDLSITMRRNWTHTDTPTPFSLYYHAPQLDAH